MQCSPISKVSEVVSGDDVDLRNGALVHQSLGGFRGRRVPDNDDLEGFLICCNLINDDNLQDVNIVFVTLAKDSYDQSKNVPQEAQGSKPCTHPKKIIFVKIKIQIIEFVIMVINLT